jgi:hypothetical protein
MNMTNREESSAAEHETYPGPGPLKADDTKRGMRPVEQMVDAAIERLAAVERQAANERIARETAARAAKAGSSAVGANANTPSPEPGHAITLARSDAEALLALDSNEDSEGSQLARVTDKRTKGRLRWKGLEVSDEFRSYADRVARGEDLPPFTGKILAEPDPAFPWDPNAHKHAARRALKQQIGLWTGVALFLGLSVAVLVVQVRKQTDAWQAPESPLASVTLASQPEANHPEANHPEAAPAPGIAAANAPAAFNEGALEPAQNEPALAANGASEANVGSNAAAAQNAAGAAQNASAGNAPAVSQASRPAAAAPRAAVPSAGVLVATRAPDSRLAPPAAALAPVAASGTAASEPALKAIGTGGTPASASVAAAADVAGVGDSASALRADPKKEPTREASGMGSLLVESPSF